MIYKTVETLMKNFSITGLKLGTETEDCSFEEIQWIQEQIPANCPLTLKIGGVEAKNDIRFALKIRLNKILAPMVESRYGLENFINVITDLEKEYDFKPQKAFNLETELGTTQLGEMVKSPAFKLIDSVTIGRGDLSQSMGEPSVNTDKVNNVVRKAINILHELGKPISIGGSVNKASIEFFKSFDFGLSINTRNVVIDIKKEFSEKEILDIIDQALNFEVLLCRELANVFPDRAHLYLKRIDVLKGRM